MIKQDLIAFFVCFSVLVASLVFVDRCAHAQTVIRTGGAGTHIQQSAPDTGTIAYTIPSDADAVIFASGGYAGTISTPMLTAVNFDGAGYDFTLVGRAYWNAPDQYNTVEVAIMTRASPDWPGTGAQTVSWAATPSISEGLNIHVFAYRNVDIFTPIGAVATRDQGSSCIGCMTLLPPPDPEDMGIVVVNQYAPRPETIDCAPAGSGQTEVFNSMPEFNKTIQCIGEELGEASLNATTTWTDGLVLLSFNLHYSPSAPPPAGPTVQLLRRRER